VEIRHMTSANPEFITLMDSYLHHGAIEAELVKKMKDWEGKDWFLAIENDRVIGFCAAVLHPDLALLESLWVHPDRRREGVGRELFNACLAHYPTWRMQGYCSQSSRRLYLLNGFEAVDHWFRNDQEWWLMRRDTAEMPADRGFSALQYPLSAGAAGPTRSPSDQTPNARRSRMELSDDDLKLIINGLITMEEDYGYKECGELAKRVTAELERRESEESR
jgi:N-acetylglutamate synthase-like GNAT family acetyltransferase